MTIAIARSAARDSATMLISRPRPTSSAVVQMVAASPAASLEPARSPVAKRSRASARSASGVVPHIPSTRSGSGSAGRVAAAAS